MQDLGQKNMDVNNKMDILKTDKGRKFYAVYLTNIVAVPGVNLTCDINNEIEAKGVREAFDNNEQVVVVTSKTFKEQPEIDDFVNVGCLCTVKRIMPQGANIRVLLAGDMRVSINKITLGDEFSVLAEIMVDENPDSPKSFELMEEIREQMRILANERALPGQLQTALIDDELEPAQLGDMLIHFLA